MTTVAVIGLGYVGLPLAIEFGKVFDTVGFDLSMDKIASLRGHHDPTGEVTAEQFAAAGRLRVTDDPGAIAEADFLVVAVPHAALRERGVAGIAARLLPGAVLADVKSVFAPAAVTDAGLRRWRL